MQWLLLIGLGWLAYNAYEGDKPRYSPWMPKAYEAGAHVTYQGKVWRAEEATTSKDRPGVSPWAEVAQ
jgi:hypothetical protein